MLLFFINLAIITISIIHCIPLCLLYSFILKLTQKWPVRAISNWPFPFYFSAFSFFQAYFLTFHKKKKKSPRLVLYALCLSLEISDFSQIPCSFNWRMYFEKQNMIVSCFHSYWLGLHLNSFTPKNPGCPRPSLSRSGKQSLSPSSLWGPDWKRSDSFSRSLSPPHQASSLLTSAPSHSVSRPSENCFQP